MLRFDDTAGSEQVLVRSQRRLDIRAFGSTYETTSGNRNAIIGWKDPDSDKQGGDFDITIGNDYQVHVNGGRYERVEKRLQPHRRRQDACRIWSPTTHLDGEGQPRT